MNSLQSFKDDFILLLESGFIAVNQMDEKSALNLFKASEILEENNIMPQVGIGYLYFHKLEIKKAIAAFKSALEIEPNNEMAKTLLGICYSLMPSNIHDSENILEETKKSKNPYVKKLSNTTLDFIDDFVKKEPSPVEVQKKKKNNKKKKTKGK